MGKCIYHLFFFLLCPVWFPFFFIKIKNIIIIHHIKSSNLNFYFLYKTRNEYIFQTNGGYVQLVKRFWKRVRRKWRTERQFWKVGWLGSCFEVIRTVYRRVILWRLQTSYFFTQQQRLHSSIFAFHSIFTGVFLVLFCFSFIYTGCQYPKRREARTMASNPYSFGETDQVNIRGCV